jgi:hypothetical protein
MIFFVTLGILAGSGIDWLKGGFQVGLVDRASPESPLGGLFARPILAKIA